jgi:adenosylmethionine-8-amino-7-oxononanoate aminotransferase
VNELDALLEFDRAHLWHPYGSMREPAPVNPVAAAHGVRITLADGTELIDAVSSWWCMAHGHNHPKITVAVKAQLDKFAQVMFAGFTHAPAVELGKKLLAVLPPGLTKVFYADSGSIAAEVAIKMALQYQHGIGAAGRNRLLTVRGGYHGDTLATMALGDPDGMHAGFAGVMPKPFFVGAPGCRFDEPWDDRYFREVEETVGRHGDEIAAVMLEPVFQGAGGMRFYSPQYLVRLRELCDRTGILLICDEIATGFGRTGEFFACGHAGISPDIICVGKALTGGVITLAATCCTDRVADGISQGRPGKLMHGPTFMASPLACAAGCASLDLFRESDWRQAVRRIEAQLKRELAPAAEFAGVADVRVLGAIGVIELKKPVAPAEIQGLLLRRGVWLRPFDRYLYTMPPLVISPEELSRVSSAMLAIAAGER